MTESRPCPMRRGHYAVRIAPIVRNPLEAILNLPHHASRPLPPNLRTLYRVVSILWALYAIALAFWSYGSVLLSFASFQRPIVTGIALLVAAAMIVRAIVPDRPGWTAWTLPLVIGASVATFCLTLFAADFAGGFTAARVGVALLVLVPAGFAHVHYMGEKAVAPR